MLISEGCQAPSGVPCRSYVVASDKNITFYYIHVFFLSLFLIFVNAMLC